MITEDKLHHILGVARKCYKISQLCGESENFCRKMFMIGWMHDVGYEYNPESHAAISKEMFLSCLNPATQAVNYPPPKGSGLLLNGSPDSGIGNDSYDIQVMIPLVDATDHCSIVHI